MKVAYYLRVSTDGRGQTVENQRLPLREFCVAQGWDDMIEYADEASASDLRGRAGWRWLLDDCARRKVDLVLCWRPDRCFGSVLDAAETLTRLRHRGVGIRSFSEPWLDTTSPFGEALFHITVAHAQLERQVLAERTPPAWSGPGGKAGELDGRRSPRARGSRSGGTR